jgi:hypothetical protein
MSAVETVDALYVHVRELVTLRDGPPKVLGAVPNLGRLGVIEDGAVAVRDGRIVAVGHDRRADRAVPQPSASSICRACRAARLRRRPHASGVREDAPGRVPHALRRAPTTWRSPQAGGGILSSVRARPGRLARGPAAVVRRTHFDGFLAHGHDDDRGEERLRPGARTAN